MEQKENENKTKIKAHMHSKCIICITEKENHLWIVFHMHVILLMMWCAYTFACVNWIYGFKLCRCKYKISDENDSCASFNYLFFFFAYSKWILYMIHRTHTHLRSQYMHTGRFSLCISFSSLWIMNASNWSVSCQQQL